MKTFILCAISLTILGFCCVESSNSAVIDKRHSIARWKCLACHPDVEAVHKNCNHLRPEVDQARHEKCIKSSFREICADPQVLTKELNCLYDKEYRDSLSKDQQDQIEVYDKCMDKLFDSVGC